MRRPKFSPVGGIPDLAIAAEDITLSDPDVKAFETVDLIVTVRNIGSEPVVNIPIQIYDNDALLTELTLEGVNAASSNKAIITTGFTADTHNIRVMVDPGALHRRRKEYRQQHRDGDVQNRCRAGLPRRHRHRVDHHNSGASAFDGTDDRNGQDRQSWRH